jgi:hypothetical protein
MKNAMGVTVMVQTSGLSVFGMSRRVAQAERVQAIGKTRPRRASIEHPCAATRQWTGEWAVRVAR